MDLDNLQYPPGRHRWAIPRALRQSNTKESFAIFCQRVRKREKSNLKMHVISKFYILTKNLLHKQEKRGVFSRENVKFNNINCLASTW